MSVNTDIYDKLVDRAAMVRLYEENAKGKVFALIDGHEVRIAKFLEKAKGKYSAAFWNDVDDELRKTFRNVHNVSKKSLLDLVGATISYGYQTLDATIGNVWRTQKPANRIAEDIVLKRPLYNDVVLEQGWLGIAAGERKRIESIIRKGLSEGLTEKQIALEVRKSNIFSITKTQSEALVITATTSVVAQTDHEVYAANKGALQGYQYIAVLDSRTTPVCMHRDGMIYPIGDIAHLPPAHYKCRSRTTPVVKSYEQLKQLESVAQLRKRNLDGLSTKEIARYDGMGPQKESYHDWLYRQSRDVQLRHLGDEIRLDMFRSGKLTLDKFIAPSGAKLNIKQLREITDEGGNVAKFAIAKNKLDQLMLGVSRPDELMSDPKMIENLREYYLLQAGDLEGTLSITNYRGQLLHTKRATRNRVLNAPPTEDQLKFNPITGRYEDVRLYQPSPAVLQRSLRLVSEDGLLKPADKEFINKFIDSLELKMSVNERAVVADNLRIVFTRFRKDKQPWGNFKAVLNSQMQFDVMNVSEYIETQLRKDADLLHRLKLDNYIDPVLGPVQLDELHDNFHSNIKAKIRWEDKVAPKIARELRNVLDRKIPPKLWVRLDDNQLDEFYLRFANRLSLADSPDRDQLAVSLGRDLYNSANWRGSRREWYNLGVKILDDAADKGFYKLETFGVQKRRMKSRMSGAYFGPYYDTFAVNLRIVDPRIQEYARLTRAVEVGMRVPALNPEQRLLIREGYKTYFIDDGILGQLDTRIPITSTSSFSDFPVELVDENMADALNWSGSSKYKVDPEFYDFIEKLLFFKDDKGKAAYYDSLNQYREHIAARGDAYERFKAMRWLRDKDAAFSNNAFLDHRARIYERGFIGPQSGESFRPFLSTDVSKPLGVDGYYNLQDQIGAFLGGLNDKLEGPYNSLTITGRQKVAERWRAELIKIGNAALRGKPNDIRAILDSEFVALVDGEEQGKMFRLAIEMAKIDQHLKGDFGKRSVKALMPSYSTPLALEQDAKYWHL